MKFQRPSLLPFKEKRTKSACAGTSPTEITVKSSVTARTAPIPISRARRARKSSLLSPEDGPQLTRSSPSSPLVGTPSSSLASGGDSVSIRTASSPTYTMKITVSGRLNEENNLFLPQECVSCNVESPEGHFIDNCPFSCSQLMDTIADTPMAEQVVGNASPYPQPPPVAPRGASCTSSNRWSPPPPQTTTNISSRSRSDTTPCSKPSLGDKTPPPIPSKIRKPKIASDTTTPINCSSIASLLARETKPNTRCNDQGIDQGSAPEKNYSDYGYIEAIPPRGWHSGASRCTATTSSEYIIIQDPSTLLLPRKRDVDFFVTGGETRTPVRKGLRGYLRNLKRRM